jgi:UDP-N-acetyl-D-glucosamine dehydrogenase
MHELETTSFSLQAERMEIARPIVCIQGLGFVGIAMATAVASAREHDGTPRYRVVGVELPTEGGYRKVAAINKGELPVVANDSELEAAFYRAVKAGNLSATTDPIAFESADVAVVDVHLDVHQADSFSSVDFTGLQAAIRTLGERLRPGALIIVETTVPPGTCARILAPELSRTLEARGLLGDSVLLAHSYERVMPGKDYYNSIVNFWRVYAGLTPKAADACGAFLSTVVNVKRYPLSRLSSVTASETAKVLENSYRAVNIAFIEEWGRFAEKIGIDLFEVLEAIRVRPTHRNIRQPGFGVGGYCLTKDPLLGEVAARQIFGVTDLGFPFSKAAVEKNRTMPLVTLERLTALLGGSLNNKTILLLGVSYREDVGDTRHSPSQLFVTEARERGGVVFCRDPLVSWWSEMETSVGSQLPDPAGIDAVVFVVPHSEYRNFDWADWLGTCRPVLLDANNVLTAVQRQTLTRLGHKIASIGRGE